MKATLRETLIDAILKHSTKVSTKNLIVIAKMSSKELAELLIELVEFQTINVVNS